jgi:phosphopantetheinyl transferase
MTPGTVSIHVIPPELRSANAGWLFLSPTERVRAASFVFPKHAAHWVACRAAMRRILGHLVHVPPAELPVVVSDLGKPGLAEPFDSLHFSLTHCEDLALLAVCGDGPVGVDVEPSSRASELIDCESTFCHPSEIDSLPAEPAGRGARLLELWTAKEALLKALGTGFMQPPETVRIHSDTASSDAPLAGIDDQVIHRLAHPALEGYCAAVSAPRSAIRIEILPFEASTSATSPVITGLAPAHTDG